MKQIQLMRDNVLISPQTEVKISDVIFVTEDTTALPPAVGQVLAVGPDVTDVVAGDTVHFERFDWTAAPRNCIIIKEGEIFAVEK